MIKLAKILNFDKNSMIKEIKKQKNWIKLDTEDWETIAATVEEQITKEDTQLTINWNTIVEIYQNTHQEIIEKKKLNIEEENKAMENCSNEEILNKNPQLYIKNMIIKRDRLLYLEYIGHRIEKFLNKLLDKLYNKYCRETAKNFQIAKRMYIAISTLPNWNEDNMIKKRNKLKLESLVKLYNNKETIEDKKLDIDKLRDPMYRKSFKENIGKIKQTYKQKIKERVHDHYKKWTKKRNIDLDSIDYNEEWRNIYQLITEINEQIYDGILEDITIEELDNIIKETKAGKAAGISGIPYDFWKKIIVNGEFTKEYKVEDGVDQDETWSPLLWRIFYDALLTRLEKIKEETGYTMETIKHIDINKNILKKLEITYNALAFIDDTTLIGGNKQKLLKMTEICHKFFEINNIKANIKKYELIRINSSEESKNNDLIINNEKIEKVNNPEGNRFLGIYFRHDNRRKVYKDKIRSMINDACRLIYWKKLKEKQIIAIWNIVIIPRIEYQMQAIVLTEDECNELMRKINVLIKHSSDLPSTTPNFLLYDKNIYGLKHIYNLQIKNLTKNIIYIMNDKGRLKEIMELKMIQEQNKIWTRQCIGNLNSISFRRQNSWLINAIDLLKKEKISICKHEYNDRFIHHCIEGGMIEIIEFLTENEIEKSSLSRKKKERKAIITWNDSEGEIIFSKNKKKSRSEKYKRIGVHLIPNSTSINDEDNSPTLIVCTGCNKNIKRINDGICHIYIENENSRIINNRKEDNKLKPYESFGDIKNRNEKLIKDKISKKRLIIEEEEESNIDNINFNKRIDQIDQTIKASENFIEELKNNILENTKEIYDIFIQVNKEKMKLQKKKKITTYISSIMITSYYNKDIIYWRKNFRLDSEDDNKTKKWLQSIILILLLFKENSKINLIIEKSIVKEIIYFQELNNRRKLDINHHLELNYILSYIINHNLQIDIRDKGEDLDYLKIINKLEMENESFMKNDKNIEAIYIKDEILKTNEYNIYWNNNLVKWAYRRWSKIISQAKWKHELLHCKLVEDLFINNYKDEFDWETSLEFISNRNQCRKMVCNSQDSLDRTYKIKNLLTILPTYKLLYDQGTNKINIPICPRCEEDEETWEHIWIYINGQPYENEDNNKEQEDEDNIKKKFDNTETFNDIKVEFVLFLDSKSAILSNKTRYWELLRGMFNKNLNNIGKKKKGSKEMVKRLWELCYDNIKKEIWHKRIENTIEIEKQQGITKRDKRKRKKEEGKSQESENNKKQKNNNKEKTKKQNQNEIIKLVTYERSKGRSTNTGKRDERWNTIQKLIPIDK
ncbi:hypothetical protein GLOIN_2v1771092 [Rhizophagus clarus]|uniref:Reverse transcriptase domain-containing protein n=1 Tax=Rhizophagus clarus TaxID=94130 RepID=A0A8H3LS35_9GLOM|nr:hypothetical protein GLOIN_2v1771092 [Rhizophagus clarus]